MLQKNIEETSESNSTVLRDKQILVHDEKVEWHEKKKMMKRDAEYK